MPSRKLLKTLNTSLLIASLIMVSLAGVIGYAAFTKKPYIVKEYTLFSIKRRSEYSLKFLLTPNEVFGEELSYDPKTPIYLSIVKFIHINYSLDYRNATASGNLNMTVNVVHPDGWSKTYLLISKSFNNTSRIIGELKLNLSRLLMFMNNLTSELGLKPTPFDVIVDTSVKSRLKVGSRVVMDPFTHSITLAIDTRNNKVVVKGNLSNSATISRKISKTKELNIVGFNINTLRLVSVILAVVGISLLTTSTFLLMRLRSFNTVEKFEKKYSDILVTTDSIPKGSNVTKISLSNLEELAKLARLLERPILKLQPSNGDELQYFIVDRDVVYVVKVGRNS
ncbi:MAG: hypothetical protein B6U85_03785 [Desulfurococcales archaeon ex4484_42]|nr:MAG: hypothetical protein B6U85_03785 [Desulfurococcales archaeon ex4484_42]